MFQHKRALITGASAGIGAALARELAAHGADLALVARRRDRLEALAAELGPRVRVVAVTGDVTQDGSMEDAAAATVRALGGIDLVVANAGFAVIGRFERLSLDDYRRQLETNLFGVMRTVRATLPALKQSRGQVAIIGSIAGHIPTPRASAYHISKFGLRALAECLHDELRPAGVGVTLISPGFVVSDIGHVDNRGQRHDQDASSVPPWIRMPTDRAARQIVTAIAARRREAIITPHGKLLVFLYRHLPWLVRSALRGLTRRPRTRAD